MINALTPETTDQKTNNSLQPIVTQPCFKRGLFLPSSRT